MLICKHHELTSGVSTEKHRGEGGWRFQLGLWGTPAALLSKLLPLPGSAGREMKAMK